MDDAHGPVPLRCRRCGANTKANETACSYCAAELALEDRGLSALCAGCGTRARVGARFCRACGAEIAPSTEAHPLDAACPRCARPLREIAVEQRSFADCGACGGVWLAPGAFEGLAAAADLRSPLLEVIAALPAPREAVDTQAAAYLPCPVCDDRMQRRNFAGASGVIIDVCRGHGVWLDHGELERALEFARHGGLERERERRRARPKPTEDSMAGAWIGEREERGPEFDLLDLLVGLFRAPR